MAGYPWAAVSWRSITDEDDLVHGQAESGRALRMSDQMSMGATMRSTPGGLHLSITDRPDADQFEAQLDGQVVGRQPYRRYQGHIVLLSTEVAEAWRERGISSALIDGVLELVRAAKTTVAPRCKVTADYILRHPEHQDLIPEQYRSLLQPISRPNHRLVTTNPGSRPRDRQGDEPTP